jgi:putative addiction module component (TIGR02574 family)
VSSLEAVTKEALRLSLPERVQLAERLLESLDGLTEREVEALWADEAERRLAAYSAGAVEAHPAESVHDAIQRRLE